MVKFSGTKAQSVIKDVLILIVGIIGAKAVKGLVESKFPQFAQYTNYGVLAAALAGTMAGKAIIQNVAKGSLLFAAVQVINQFVPSSATKYMPSISGVRGVRGLGNMPQPAQIPNSAVTLGNSQGSGVGAMVL